MDPKGEELAAVIAEIRQRVRARHPNGVVAGEVVLPDLTPLLHARDSAEGKVASIGTVNPRPPGVKNFIIQTWKRMLARVLDWHVREQVEFNRAVMACVQASIESLNECKLSMAALGARIGQEANDLHAEARELKDIRAHWAEWRAGWEQKLANNEVHLLRSLSALQASFQHRVTLMDANYREQVKEQHADYEGALARSCEEIQKRLWSDFEVFQKRVWEDLAKLRGDYDAILHSELRVLRQKLSFAKTAEPAVRAAPAELTGVDWLRFAERFRGSEADIRQRNQLYVSRFQASSGVLDIGCGRGEMLDVLREAGIQARGIDLHDESIALCQSKGLAAEKADLFAYLSGLADSSLGGVVCCQVVEHIPPERLPELVRLLHAKLRAGALAAIETPNPECLAIFATHFYLDPTHRHPIPAALMSYYLEEAGFGRVEVERLSPAIQSMPALAELPEAFRKDFFGGLDYVVFAVKLG